MAIRNKKSAVIKTAGFLFLFLQWCTSTYTSGYKQGSDTYTFPIEFSNISISVIAGTGYAICRSRTTINTGYIYGCTLGGSGTLTSGYVYPWHMIALGY